MEILGNNLKRFFDTLDKAYESEVMYSGKEYEVWDITEDQYKIMCAMTEEGFASIAGDDSWWRSSQGTILGIPDTEFKVNGEYLLGWNSPLYGDKSDQEYANLAEYLCECIGVSVPKNVCACCMDLAKYNDMTMAELFQKYQG